MATEHDYPWVLWDPDQSEANKNVGDALVALLTWNGWIFRKVERLRLIGEAQLRRAVSLDFRLPSTKPSRDTYHLVPMAVWAKELLVALDVRDEGGSALPVLTKDQGNDVAWYVLISAAGAVNPARTADVTVLRTLKDVVDASPSDAMEIAERLKQANAWLFAGPSGAVFEKLLIDLAQNYIFLVPIRAEAGQRRILKLSYNEALPARRKASEWWRRPLWALGWAPTPFDVEVPGIAGSPSYHFEMEMPEGLECVGGEMNVETQLTPPATSVLRLDTHVHMRAAQVPLDAIGSVRVDMRAPPRGLVRRTFAGSTLVAGLFAAGAIWDDRLRQAVGGARSPDAAVTILLAALTFIVGYLARPGEHLLVSRTVLGFRMLGMLAAFLSFSAAIVVLGGVRGITLSGIWFKMSMVAVLVAALTGISLLRARARPRTQGGETGGRSS